MANPKKKKKKRLNEQVKRNKERFPDDFMFQLTHEEWNVLQSQFATTKDLSKIRTLPYVFTRNGIGMLSSVLGSRVFHLEQHQQETDEKINYLIAKMDDKKTDNNQIY